MGVILHFDILNYNLLYEQLLYFIQIAPKYVPKGPVNNAPALVLIMACRRTGDKPLSEPMIVYFHDACIRHSASVN